jgi:hypothetical protein
MHQVREDIDRTRALLTGRPLLVLQQQSRDMGRLVALEDMGGIQAGVGTGHLRDRIVRLLVPLGTAEEGMSFYFEVLCRRD